ncbi:hypothetical protein [Streptomyces sp. NPDC051636]|uniref:hypothetical protein n=1 Tax=Streptomyces sp. NPDC051636 TaxID=3365663 RepID=UPI00378758E1
MTGCAARYRMRLGRDAEPTAGVIDSQSIKADAVVAADSCGFDGGKQINGRKRRGRHPRPAAGRDGYERGCRRPCGRPVLLPQVTDAHHMLALIWADGGYTGSLVEYCLAALALAHYWVTRSPDPAVSVLVELVGPTPVGLCPQGPYRHRRAPPRVFAPPSAPLPSPRSTCSACALLRAGPSDEELRILAKNLLAIG